MDEKQTREQLIDKQLKSVGWLKKYIKEEVNSVKSKFKTKEYTLSSGLDDNSGRFIDYLLLAEDNSPIALIEAKKFSVSEDKGRAQSRTYLRDIESQTKEKIPIFLTNGNKWLLIDQDGIERRISGPFSQSDLMRRIELYRKRRDPTKINNDNPAKDYPDKNFEYIDISSINNNNGKIVSSKRRLGKDAPSRAKQKVKYNDLIISTVRPNLNSAALIPKNLNDQICSTGFCVLRANLNKVSPEFLFHVSRSSKFIQAMVKIAKGASYPAVSDRDIKNYVIPLPPIALQNKFASIVKEVEKLKEHQKKSREKINNLFNALMQKAFSGELKI